MILFVQIAISKIFVNEECQAPQRTGRSLGFNSGRLIKRVIGRMEMPHDMEKVGSMRLMVSFSSVVI